MFNIGPMELLVLMVVGLVVIGPEKLPNLAKDAARMLRDLREVAGGARKQLRDELGPEFADVDLSVLNDLRALNPRTAITRALLGDGDAPAASSSVPAAEPRIDMQKPVQQPLGRGERAPFDADAT